MKENFKEYYKATEDEFKFLWENCEFIFDANVLLNIYRYSSETTEKFLDVLTKVQDRIWLPHQAALEYQRNRFSVIEEQVTKCKELEKLLEKNEILTFLSGNKRHPFVDTEIIISKIEKTFNNLKVDLETSRNNYPNTISNDDLRDTLTEIFDGKIGDEFSKKDLDNTYKMGKERYLNKIPPGFEDKKKPENQKYGDCILWHQIITHAKSEGKPIILVTDDAKKDWWLKNKNDAIIGPHPLLIREMRLKSNVDFYMYRTEIFMERVKIYLGLDVDQSSLQEIENIQNDIRIEHINENLMSLQYWLKHKQIKRAEIHTKAQAEMYAEALEEMHAETQAEMYAEAQAEMYAEAQAEMYAEAQIEMYAEALEEMHAEAQAEMEPESQENVESDD